MTTRQKDKIKFFLANIDPSSISKIYGGQTERKIEERLDQHQKADSQFRRMTIKKITRITDGKKANECETYLIEKLKEKFKGKCINQQTVGGAGQNHNPGDKHAIYVCYY